MSASPYRRLLRTPPRLPRRRSHARRGVLALVVAATLPFLWSEDVSCNGEPAPPISGFEILFGKDFDHPGPGLVFLALLLVTVGLSFLASRTSRPWRRLAAEATAGMTALGTTFLCMLMMNRGRPDQPLDRPAAWIGTLAALGMAFEAWWCSGDALRQGVEERRLRRPRARVAREPRAGPRIQVADPDGDGPEEEVEEEGTEGGEARRKVLPPASG